MRFGSLINLIKGKGRPVDATGKPVEPEPGMGATEIMFSDRHAGTIAEVIRYKSGPKAGQIRAIVWQRDKATCTDYYRQTYTYAPDPDAPREVFTLRANGTYRQQGRGSAAPVLAIGSRDEHQDISR